MTSPCIIELHGFAEAFSRACRAIIYIRVISGKEVRVNFFGSKSQVAPLKQMSIPRLELQAATLLAELVDKVT